MMKRFDGKHLNTKQNKIRWVFPYLKKIVQSSDHEYENNRFCVFDVCSFIYLLTKSESD